MMKKEKKLINAENKEKSNVTLHLNLLLFQSFNLQLNIDWLFLKLEFKCDYIDFKSDSLSYFKIDSWCK